MLGHQQKLINLKSRNYIKHIFWKNAMTLEIEKNMKNQKSCGNCEIFCK